jgi:2-isopropylmalate synthase
VRAGRLRLAGYVTTNDGVAGTPCTIDATLTDGVAARTVYGDGTGPIDAFVDGVRRAFGIDVHVRDYYEHAVRAGEDASAVSYVEVAVDGVSVWGVGIDPNIVTASLAAIVSAISRTVDPIALRPADRTAPEESPHEAIVV